MNWRKRKKLWKAKAWRTPHKTKANGSNKSLRTMNEICGYPRRYE